ncbi:MAG: NrdH-redoxin [Shinella sp.]|nr:MAG: NrdH-redoxin [Shinella sp.]
MIASGPRAGDASFPSVIVYTLPLCARSIATMRDLAQHGVPFCEIDLSQDVTARAHVEALGYMRAPVVVAGSEHWAGYNPEAISRIAAKKANHRPPADFRMVDAGLTRR